ncbi:hypothetical protein NA78x_005860 [Anatilimnocola sp. NA78]|uniref:hypothetical protein n=1 Tax=Anatilimnocola sp. NA78 TaxID=3415683 RepID=UPI003CE47228
MHRTRINFVRWAWRVVAWDGVLPLVLLGLPHFIRWLIPNADKVIEIAAVVLPIGAFFTRMVAGCLHIRTNRCGPRLRSAQQAALFCGVFVLVLFDAFVILQLNIPAGAIPHVEVVATGLVVFSIYLPFLTFAMYPGREPVPYNLVGNWEIQDQVAR